jgi:pyruvate dehydrogenase E2 component (dihydrolipoamide acetyltransferase)
MSVEVVMPQMGESITEGTVSKWLKQVGERIEKDEAILEISTDKVDAEVPSPGAGVLLEIRHQEGETVEVGTILAVIGAENEAGAPSVPSAPAHGGALPSIDPPAPEIPAMIADEVSETPTVISETVAASSASTSPVDPQSAIGDPGSTEVVMPQMGESITEGTVSKWLKSVGDTIEKDEALLEISTDKVDAEVPSPAAGKLLAINVQEGETVEVGAVLALVGAEGANAVPSSKSHVPSPSSVEIPVSKVHEPETIAEPVQAVAMPVATNGGANGSKTVDDLRRAKSSPLVRNIAKEHGVDITRIPGSGLSGRVTKSDILSFIETGAALRPQDLLRTSVPAAIPAVATPVAKPAYEPPKAEPMTGDRVEKMSVMRKKIAEHMTFSKQTSAHVTSVYEIDMTNIARFRDRHKEAFQQQFGTKLTFMPFIFQAVTNAIKQHRIVNSQVSADDVIYKSDINLGMAVALDWGLIVPVIKNADNLSLSQLAVTANDLADRARTKKLNPDEVTGGTFTITNPGVFGGLFGTPIINQPQVAILCIGTIEKRAKVVATVDGDDAIVIRQMAYFALTYDHRVVDGADAEKFLSFMKEYLERNEFTF